ncbi:17015_t:CDS:2, partial [Cetraspora pellucida]
MQSEIDSLRQCITELEARKAELEIENAKIPELRKKLAENTTNIVVKLEQKQLQNDNTPSNNSFNFNLVANYYDKPLEDKKIDTFLDEQASDTRYSIFEKIPKISKPMTEISAKNTDTNLLDSSIDNSLNKSLKAEESIPTESQIFVFSSSETSALSIPLSHASNSENKISENNKYLLETKSDYDDENGIEGKYKIRSYNLKYEQNEIEIEITA